MITRVAPVLAALLLISGVCGAALELLSPSGTPRTAALGWATMLANLAVVAVSACSLVLFKRARGREMNG